MPDDPNDLPAGFPGGYVPIIGSTDDDTPPEVDAAPNGSGDRDGYTAAFGRHPMADWKPEIRRKRRRR